MQHVWKPRPADTAPDALALWAEELSISPLIADILWQRGMASRDEMNTFLAPVLRHLAPPDTVPGMDEAARVLAEGLAAGKRFCVWGDYDVDGVTSTALVKDFCARRGLDAAHHIPNRLEHGYGMNADGVRALAEAGVELLLTVDNGISSHEEIALANELGMTVVVSDHHLPEAELPPAAAVTNPRLGECPCPDLAGVGVAWLLMCRVNRLLPGDPVDMRQFLDLVALGTIADVVRLHGQNRILVKNGLLLVGKAKRPGIAALKEAAGYAPAADLGAGQVGFGLAPRINASGRLGDAQTALDLLLAPDYDAARPLARHLDELNSERRGQEDRILKEALAQAEAQPKGPGLVLFGEDWHPGVIGIVASRIVEAYYRPTLVLTREGDVLKGSGRSTRECNLHEALCRCSDLLATFGGHPMAAGLSLAPGNLGALRERFDAAVAKQCGPEPLSPTLFIDGELPFPLVDFDLLKELEMLQPFGPSNAQPVFASPPVLVKDRRTFGKNHVKLVLMDEDSGVTLNAKAWRQAEAIPADLRGKRIRIAYTPKIDRYQGVASIDLQIKDWQVD